MINLFNESSVLGRSVPPFSTRLVSLATELIKQELIRSIDRDTGDVITLEEFEKRILMREQTKLKRKVGGVGEIEDNSRSEKKLCFQF